MEAGNSKRWWTLLLKGTDMYWTGWSFLALTEKLAAIGGRIKAPKVLISSGPEPGTILGYTAKAN